MVARLRPRRPIVGLSHHQYALQQMALEWGVTPLLIPEQPNVEDLWGLSIESARAAGMVQPGERLFVVKGIGAWRRAHEHRGR